VRAFDADMEFIRADSQKTIASGASMTTHFSGDA